MSQFEYTYVLYVLPGELNSEVAIKKVEWGPNGLSADGQIRFEDIRAIIKKYGQLPEWFRGVPTLVNIHSKTQWTGRRCRQKLDKWLNDYNASRPKGVPQGIPMTGTNLLDDTSVPFVLPPDPRDEALLKWSAPKPVPQQIVQNREDATGRKPKKLPGIMKRRVPSDDEGDDEYPSDLFTQLKSRMRVPSDEEEADFPPPDKQFIEQQRRGDIGSVLEDDNGVRTVTFNVSVPKSPKTPTLKASTVPKTSATSKLDGAPQSIESAS